MRMYPLVSGVAFGLLALVQGTRAMSQLPFQVGQMAIPVWVSWAIAAVAGFLCVWAFTEVKR